LLHLRELLLVEHLEVDRREMHGRKPVRMIASATVSRA
jgi:hypothetical protein